jgi:phosphoglucosamine mutase
MTEQKLFGTDGVRGTANTPPMTPEMALRLGKALGRVFRNTQDIRTVLIGKDTRLSGYLFETALTSGITAMGLDVFLVGPMPTPAVAHLTKSLCANAGIMISASHNPAPDNGIKIFSEKGMKLSDQKEAEIERIYFSSEIESDYASPDKIGKAFRMDQAQGRYIEFAKSTIGYQDLSGIRMVLDCANGAGYSTAPVIFRELGVDLTVIHNKPDGMNINAGCGSQELDDLIAVVKETGSDCGLALDGDADRIIMVDHEGHVVDGDQILALAALRMKDCGTLKHNTVVSTVMSNIGLSILFRDRDINLVQTQVGDRHVIDEMVGNGFNLGGEQSGHIIFSDHNLTGDGILAGLQVLSIIKDSRTGLSELASVMKRAPQKLINIRVKEKPEISSLDSMSKAIEKAESTLGDQGRLLIRYSGTEPIARVLVEGVDRRQVDELAADLANVLKSEIGV